MLANTTQPSSLATPADPLFVAGQVANQFATRRVFQDYQGRKAVNTLRRQYADLSLFARYLQSAGLSVGDFQNDPEAWRGLAGDWWRVSFGGSCSKAMRSHL